MDKQITYKGSKKPKKSASKKKKIGAISTGPNILLNILFVLYSCFCILPFILVAIVSVTDEKSLVDNGYSFIPDNLSFKAYKYLFTTGEQMFRSFGISLTVTVVGTCLGVLIMSMYAYGIFRKDFRFRKHFSFLAFITMLFSGGIVPTYLVCTQMLHLKDSILALILPLCVGPFYIMILRTFFQTSVPESLIESATLDGAGEFRILLQVVAPISLPGIATIALFTTLDYWNDWYNAMLYINTESLYPLQYLLMSIQDNMDFIMRNRTQITGSQVEIFASMPKESVRMAMVVVGTIPIALSYPFFQRYFIQGLQMGSVKG